MRPLTLLVVVGALALAIAPAHASGPAAAPSPSANTQWRGVPALRPAPQRLTPPAHPDRAPRTTMLGPIGQMGSPLLSPSAITQADAPTHGTFGPWCDSPGAWLYPGWSYGLPGTAWTQVWWRPWWWSSGGGGTWHPSAGWYFAWANATTEYTGRTSPWLVYYPNNPAGQQWQQLGLHGSGLWIQSPFMGLGIDVYAGVEFYWIDNAQPANQAAEWHPMSNYVGPDASGGDHCVFP